jgi:glutamate racemase
MLPNHIQVVSQGEIVAESLVSYLKRHPEMDHRLSQEKSISFYTTGNLDTFSEGATIFWGTPIVAKAAY